MYHNPNNSEWAEYPFAGRVIRLNYDDFHTWRRAFPCLDLRVELAGLDYWLAEIADNKARKNWFFLVSNILKKKQDAAQSSSDSSSAP